MCPLGAEVRPRRSRRRSGPPGSLYRRFYGYTLLVVLASMGLSFVLVTLGHRKQFFERFFHEGAAVGGLVADRLAPELDDAQRLTPAVRALAERLDARLMVFGPDRRLLASAGAALPEPSAADFDLARSGSASGFRRGAGHWVLVPIRRGAALSGYLQGALSGRFQPASGWRVAGSFALVLGLIALLMIPATRSVTRPIEQLTLSAHRFGQGDFRHRVPVCGHDEIARLGVAMNEMAERLSVLLHTQQELLANVSHELRSPLARIQVALELAREAGGAARPLAEIAADAAELDHLVDDCLAASRLELRPDSVRPVRVTVAELIAEARRRALGAGLDPARLALEVEKDLPDALADPELCGHALQNLLDNAKKHTPEGTPLALGARREGDRLRLHVGDRGPGLPAEELPRLFEPFYRPDASRSRAQGGGAGLGLSLVRRIAELHGGEPSVQSTPGEGSTFSFTVPVA